MKLETLVDPTAGCAADALESCEEKIAVLLARERRGSRLVSDFLQEIHGWNGHELMGMPTWSAYVQERTGLGVRQVQEHIRVALYLRQHPDLGKQYDRGEITFSDVIELTRRGPRSKGEGDVPEEEPVVKVVLHLNGEAREYLAVAQQVSDRLNGKPQAGWKILEDLSAEHQGVAISEEERARISKMIEELPPVGGGEEEGGAKARASEQDPPRPVEPVKLTHLNVPDRELEALHEEFCKARDAYKIDRTLQKAVRLQRRADFELGQVLRYIRDSELWNERKYGSFPDWVKNRLGMSLRKAKYLIRLDQKLEGLPEIREEYRTGRLSWLRAELIAKVALEGHEGPWIERAKAVTVNRLKADVKKIQMLSRTGTTRRGGGRRRRSMETPCNNPRPRRSSSTWIGGAPG